MNAKETVNKNKTTLLVISLLLTLLSPLYAQYFNVQNLDQRFLENLERMDVFEQMLMERWNPTFYALQQPFTYVVDKLGSYYTIQNGTTGALQYRSTNMSKVANFASGNKTNDVVSIFLKNRYYNFTSPWIIGNNTLVVGESMYGVVLQNGMSTGNGATTGLIWNENANVTDHTDYNITISNLSLDGQFDYSRFGFGIGFERVSNVQLSYINAFNWDADAINFNGLGAAQGGQGYGVSTNIQINNLYLHQNGVDGIALTNVTDFTISDVWSTEHGYYGQDANGHGLTLTWCSRGTVNNYHADNGRMRYSATAANGFQLNGAYDITFNNIFAFNNNGSGLMTSDSGTKNCYRLQINGYHFEQNRYYGAYLNNIDGSVLTNGVCLNNGIDATGLNGAGIFLIASQDVTINSARMMDNQGTKTQTCGINETGTSDRNIFSLINSRDCNNTGILTVGTDTKANLCWNLTNWLT